MITHFIKARRNGEKLGRGSPVIVQAFLLESVLTT
jgi:hypothetical protein